MSKNEMIGSLVAKAIAKVLLLMRKKKTLGLSVAKAIAGVLLLIIALGHERYSYRTPSYSFATKEQYHYISGENYYFLGIRIGDKSFFWVARSLVCAIAAYSAYFAFSKARSGQSGWGWIFGGVALLFNPAVPPLDLSRESMINIMVSIGFFSSIAWEVWKSSAKKSET